MNIEEEVMKLADAWQEEKPEGRAIIVIAIEATEVGEEKIEADTTSYVNGPSILCKEAIKGIIKDSNPNNAFRKVMSQANLEVAIEKITEFGRN